MNSRLYISNQLELAELAVQRLTHAAQLSHRAVLFVIKPPKNWLESAAQRLNCEYIAVGSTSDRSDRISALLGSERSMLVIQLGPKPDLGLFAAAAGTVKAGGLLIVGSCKSPYFHPHSVSAENSLSITERMFSQSSRRFERLADEVAQLNKQTMACVELVTHTKHSTLSTDNNLLSEVASYISDTEKRQADPQASREQDSLLTQACNHLESELSSCVVIKGRRGCGKSTLLARIASYLESQGIDFRTTALHESALSTYRQHLGTLTTYIRPESALTVNTEVLLVDEAASLPLRTLHSFLSHFRHVVFCSTIEGYEASGRAFDVRLLSSWPQKSMALLQLEPRQMWRWGPNDPLSNLIDQLLLTSRLEPTERPIDYTNRQVVESKPEKLSRYELACNETLLGSVHALLHATHYQSTTKDLEHILDSPTIEIWVQRIDNSVVAVLVLDREGNIDLSLHEDILAKARRLPNQLLPQLLSQTANDSGALTKNYIRILRLAVVSPLRRQGIASRLLRAVTAACTDDSIKGKHSLTVDALGASFATDESSIGFWRNHGYIEFHRGFKPNPRSGKLACAVMFSFDEKTSSVLAKAVDIHRENELARLHPKAVFTMADSISSRDISLLHRFCSGQRSMNDTYAPLLRLSLVQMITLEKVADLSQKQHESRLREVVKSLLTNGLGTH